MHQLPNLSLSRLPRIHRKRQRFLERVVLRAHPEVFALVLLRIRLLPAGVNVHTLSSCRMLERTLIRQLLRLLGDLLVPNQMLHSVHAAIHVMSHKSSFLELRRGTTCGQVHPARQVEPARVQKFASSSMVSKYLRKRDVVLCQHPNTQMIH